MALSDDLIADLLNQPTQHIHGLVVAKVKECIWKLDTQLTLNIPIKMPTIKYDLVGTTAGQATSRNVMRLNLAALNDPEFREYMVDQVIPHEMAHIAEYQLYNQAGHGHRWRYLCLLLGINPYRTHDLPLKKARKTTKFKYSCQCSCREHWVGKNRHSKLQMNPRYLTCKHCSSYLTFTGESAER